LRSRSPHRRARSALGQRYVLGDRHPFDEAEILMHERDALGHVRAMTIRRAADGDRSAIRCDDAAENLDQS
jgi:hypothetical protein